MKSKLFALSLFCVLFLWSCISTKKYEREEEILIKNYLLSVGDTIYTSTPNGLYYHVISEGSGRTPEVGDTVFIWYKGKLLTGQLFDTNYEQIEPYAFIVGSNSVIKGLDEGVRYIKTGGRIKLLIPSSLAFGSTGLTVYDTNTGYYRLIVSGYTPTIWEVELDTVWYGAR